MKRFFLSTGVILAFLAYSLFARSDNDGKNLLITQKQKELTQQTTPTITISPTDTPISIDSNTTTPTTTPSPTKVGKYKDGTYTGDPADAFYGNIQVQVSVSGGNISSVKFLQAPNDRSTSVFINSQADPVLAQEAIHAQSANVDIVSGATDSSQAFMQSLQSALNQAQN